jgi:hypothetical protein
MRSPASAFSTGTTQDGFPINIVKLSGQNHILRMIRSFPRLGRIPLQYFVLKNENTPKQELGKPPHAVLQTNAQPAVAENGRKLRFAAQGLISQSRKSRPSGNLPELSFNPSSENNA